MESVENPVWRRMLAGERYDAADAGLRKMLAETRRKLWQLNNTPPWEENVRQELLRGLLGSAGKNMIINTPFLCDYGRNIHIGDNFFANFNLTILDEATVTFGDNVFIGPGVSIYTACHPVDPAQRDKWVEWAEPVTVGSSVWIGGSAVILPGVTIGSESVVGAGAVVTKSVPARCIVAGNPARVVRVLPPSSPEQLGLDSCSC